MCNIYASSVCQSERLKSLTLPKQKTPVAGSEPVAAGIKRANVVGDTHRQERKNHNNQRLFRVCSVHRRDRHGTRYSCDINLPTHPLLISSLVTSSGRHMDDAPYFSERELTSEEGRWWQRIGYATKFYIRFWKKEKNYLMMNIVQYVWYSFTILVIYNAAILGF